MAQDFIPKNHEAFRAKLTLFSSWLTLNGLTFGFSIGETGAIATGRTDVDAKLTDKQAKDLAAVVANQALETSESAVTVLWRAAAKRLQAHPLMTDPLREASGITVPDRVPTPRVVGEEVPGVEVVLTTGGVFIHWGTNPTNEALNGKPGWADGANIILSIDGGPEFLAAFDRSSPYFYGVTGGPISLTIWVAYRAPQENAIGVLSAPVTVSTGG